MPVRTLSALMLTLVLLFGLQSEQVMRRFGVLLAVTILVHVYRLRVVREPGAVDIFMQIGCEIVTA